MSEQRNEELVYPSEPFTIDRLARLQDAVEVHSLRELAADIWESDEELDEFLTDLRAARRSSLG